MRKQLFILWLVSVVSTAVGIPYIFELQSPALSEAPLPVWVLGLLMVGQTAILLAAAIYFGSKLANKLNLPVLVSFNNTTRGTALFIKSICSTAVPLGVVAGLAIYIADALLARFIPATAVSVVSPAIWKTILASFYGGIVEEVLMRLFFVSLFAWLIARLVRIANPKDNSTVMWSAIILAALLFGLGHLPITATITAITPFIVLRAILLNGIGGLVFGWLYWRKGLEYSIAAHFTTDIILLVILASLF